MREPVPVGCTVTWDGDSAHRGSTATITGTVQKRPTSISAHGWTATSQWPYKVYVSGTLTGDRTGPLNTALPLTVVRTNPDGSTTPIRDVTTDKAGSFKITDVPTTAHSVYATYSYDISWSGDATYAGSRVVESVTINTVG